MVANYQPVCGTLNVLCLGDMQKNGQLRYELVAHSRWLSAMDIHPSIDTIITAAEDCTVGVWQLPIAGAKVG